jgi:hypothetical protein
MTQNHPLDFLKTHFFISGRPANALKLRRVSKRLVFTSEGHLPPTIRVGCAWKSTLERPLAHGERNNVRAAYVFAEYLPERCKMM